LTPIDRWLATLTRRSAGTTDADLLGRFVVGRDEEAFAELVRRYGPLVLGVCRRRVPDDHAAEDAFQAVFVVLAAKAGRIDAARPLGPWLHGVAVKVAARAGRRLVQRRRREVGTQDLPETAAALPPNDDPTAVLDEELARLSATYREALVLCELEGLSRRAAACRLGIAEGTLSSRLAAGRKDLARRLARRGVGPLSALVGASVSPALAEAAVRSGFAPASEAVLELSQGVLSAMIFTKLKALVAVAAVAVAAFSVVWADDTKPKPAPARPAVAEEEPQLWLLYPESGRLVVLRADGTVARTLDAPDANGIHAVSPRQNRVWFRGHDGQAQKPGGDPKSPRDWTLHVRGIEPGGVVTDLGIPLPTRMSYVVADGKTMITARLVEVAPDDRAKPGANRSGFESALVDVATNELTRLKHLPKSHQVVNVLDDGRSVLTIEIVQGGEVSKLYQVPVAEGPPRLVSDKLYFPSPSGISPDGTKALVTGQDSLEQFNVKDCSKNVYVLDVVTGKVTKISDEARLLNAHGRWSPDAKRVAYALRGWAKDAAGAVSANGVPPTRLVVRDADGKNPKTLVTSDEAFRVVAWE